MSISVFISLSTVFHFIISLDNSPRFHCSSGLISALLVLSTLYLFMKVSFSPDIILCGGLVLKHQLTNKSLPLSLSLSLSLPISLSVPVCFLQLVGRRIAYPLKAVRTLGGGGWKRSSRRGKRCTLQIEVRIALIVCVVRSSHCLCGLRGFQNGFFVVTSFAMTFSRTVNIF